MAYTGKIGYHVLLRYDPGNASFYRIFAKRLYMNARTKKMLTVAGSAVLIFTGLYYRISGFHIPEGTPAGKVPSVVPPTRTPSPTRVPSPTPTAIPTPTPDIFSGLESEMFYITYYGWPDNSPPGDAIAYPKHRYPDAVHETAGGSGTFTDPVTFAAVTGSVDIGTVYYLPYIAKYVVMEDICSNCRQYNHIDIWMNSGPEFAGEVETCQRKWTRQQEKVITDPPPGLPVNHAPIFSRETGWCR
ncbi:hypothetical protein A2Z33_02680 [Candidatus Gottesmanbacteria bacterium RBG_16_52_11]|uniref:Uncharacterized protein n=1 Tax=Candidatus Gottesmanbacteria bacterium RBG_16_52_11 TaxID=1798374 RepID=A0A1F5YMJ7_9BACT|nr:MAG: hypothetical protein A2Z33_02680 [Candidatus Gottesmanbacteria bacterium RBG_16_52_11]